MTPGRLFSINTSALAIKFLAFALSSGFFKSRVTERLLRFKEAKFSLKRSFSGPVWGGHARSVSPVPRFSNLMTSAPRSASNKAQNGPAATLQISRTRIPASGFKAERSAVFMGTL